MPKLVDLNPLGVFQNTWEEALRKSLVSKVFKDLMKYMDQPKHFLDHFIKKVVHENFQENAPLKVSFDVLLTQLATTRLKKHEVRKFMQKFIQSPEISVLLEKTITNSLNYLQQIEDAVDINDIDFKQFQPVEPCDLLKERVEQWVVQEYPNDDKRHSACDEKAVRRMDSLARLLELHHGLSVCSAVTIDCSETPRIIISANVNKEGMQKEIVDQLNNRLNCIKTFIKELAAVPEPLSPEEMEPHAQQLVNQLRQFGGYAIPLKALVHSAAKLLHSLVYDPETLQQREKDAFSSNAPVVVLLASVSKKEGHQMQAHTLTQNNNTIKMYPLDLPKSVLISQIHAEQMIGKFLQKEEMPKKEQFIGISKLCCATCYTNMNQYSNFKVRGHHGVAFQGVPDLNTNALAAENTRSGLMCSWTSPPNSPYRLFHHAKNDMKLEDIPDLVLPPPSQQSRDSKKEHAKDLGDQSQDTPTLKTST